MKIYCLESFRSLSVWFDPGMWEQDREDLVRAIIHGELEKLKPPMPVDMDLELPHNFTEYETAEEAFNAIGISGVLMIVNGDNIRLAWEYGINWVYPQDVFGKKDN